jgi:putative ABC transport system permease protein
MLTNYLKVAWRNLLKNKLYSGINIFGLALGLAVGFVILYWVNNEYSMNAFHAKADRIYQVSAKLKFGTNVDVWDNIPAPAANYAKEYVPGLENIARLKYNYGIKEVVKVNDKVFIEDKYGYTENNFFQIFDFPIVKGSSTAPFAPGLSVVIDESIAKKYFGNEDPIGKIIQFRDTSLQVSAVMKDFSASSSMQFNMLFSMDLVRAKFRGNGQWKTIEQDWGNYDYGTFALMKPGGDINRASKIIRDGLLKVNKESSVLEFPFRPLKSIYLYNADGSKGRLVMVEIFFIVGIFILLIAAINYINLVTARATQRIKEISMRKILGAEKKQLFYQFFCETAVLLLLSVVLAFVFVQLLLPVARTVTGNDLRIDIFNWQLWKVLSLLVGSIWLLSGLYPALLLSSFRPAQAMRGSGIFANTGLIRKSLVVLQFVVSISLVLGTVFIHRQMSFIQNQDLSLKTDQVIAFPTWRLGDGAVEFKSDVQRVAGVSATTQANSSLFEGVNSTTDLKWPGMAKDAEMWIASFRVDKEFIKFFDIKILEGQGLENVSPESPQWLVNETAVKKMGLKNPVGQTISFRDKPGTIIGVVKDFHFQSAHKEQMPALIQYTVEKGAFLYARVQPQHAKKVIAAAEQAYKKYEANLPMPYHYLNDQIAAQYDKETKAARLFDAFALVTMLISCLGLFGLTTYSAERRIKEIGIRKVLGAGVARIAVLLSAEFIKLVIIATIIAIPIVWYSMNKLLQDFAYRISLSWWVFGITAFSAVIIAIVTMSFQAIKAGLANPVKNLRTE